MTAETDTYLRGFEAGYDLAANLARAQYEQAQKGTSGSVRRSEPRTGRAEGERTQTACAHAWTLDGVDYACVRCSATRPHPGADA